MPVDASGRDVVFYDGVCGLCHALVRFAIARDVRGSLAYAPLHGATFLALVPADARARLPDSLVVRTPDGRLLVRMAGTAHVMRRLPAPWRQLGAVLAVVPRPLADLVYRFVAATRHAVFGRPSGACPVVPESLRERLLP